MLTFCTIYCRIKNVFSVFYHSTSFEKCKGYRKGKAGGMSEDDSEGKPKEEESGVERM